MENIAYFIMTCYDYLFPFLGIISMQVFNPEKDQNEELKFQHFFCSYNKQTHAHQHFHVPPFYL